VASERNKTGPHPQELCRPDTEFLCEGNTVFWNCPPSYAGFKHPIVRGML
jgi:hypothetical protein